MVFNSAPNAASDAPASNRFWTVSNGFSLLRMALTPVAVLLILLGPPYLWDTFGVVVVMIISDVLDGYLARRRHEITRWGKILDPLADKVAIGALTVMMVVTRGLPAWVAAVVLGRDGVIVLGSLLLLGRRRAVASSNIWGKSATLAMSLLLLSYLMDVDAVQPVLLWISAGLICVSSISYALRFKDFVRDSGE